MFDVTRRRKTKTDRNTLSISYAIKKFEYIKKKEQKKLKKDENTFRESLILFSSLQACSSSSR
jgi:hypothetical protein